MPNLYITAEQLIAFGSAPEADAVDVFELLAESVSRAFDRECNVSDGFFNQAAAVGVTERSYRADGTKYLQLYPYIANSITIIDVADDKDYFTATVADREYHEADGFLIFDEAPPVGTIVDVTARYGFTAIPADIQMACIEQGLIMWRRKDLLFSEISGVSAAVNAPLSPTFLTTVEKYRGLYGNNSYFA